MSYVKVNEQRFQNIQVINPYTKGSVSYRQFEYDDNTKFAMLYMLFCWFWTSQFIIALGQLTLAMAVTCWYFTKDKSTIGNGTVLWVKYMFMDIYFYFCCVTYCVIRCRLRGSFVCIMPVRQPSAHS